MTTTSAPIQRPKKVSANEDDRTVYLEFEDDAVTPDGNYWVRGGISWPTSTPVKGQPVPGYALLAGLCIDQNVIYVFEGQRFVTVEHIKREDNSIEYVGAVDFFKTAWHHYFATYFYWNQQPYIHEDHARQCWRSSSIEPKPHFINVDLPKPELALGPVWQCSGTNRLFWNESDAPDSLHVEMAKFQAEPNPALSSVMALGNCIAGMTKYPFRVVLDDDD